ncbi:MAG: hypothetical protein ACRD3C_22585 [Vicinamibacterales bacterium]
MTTAATETPNAAATALIDDDDIIVTSAHTKAEPAGQPRDAEGKFAPKDGAAAKPDDGAKAGEPPAKPAAEAKGAVTPADDELTPDEQAEIDKVAPPQANETPEQRTARNRRATKQILKQIGLRKDAERERDEHRRERERLQRENEDLRRGRPRDAEPPPPAGDNKAGAPPAAGKTASAPEFKFDSWEDYQETHPEATYEQYQDARSDARYEWNRNRDAAVARARGVQAARQGALQKYQERETAFKAQTPDFDDVVDAFRLPDMPQAQADDLQDLIVRSEFGPDISYLLSKPEGKADLDRLLAVRSTSQLTRVFGQIEGKVEAARAAAKPAAGSAAAGGDTKPAASAREPSKPATDAPAPVSPVPGGARAGRSLAAIASDDEDADSYIEERTRQGAGLRRGR